MRLNKKYMCKTYVNNLNTGKEYDYFRGALIY